MELGLDGATAVVVGGTQGMGRAAAECFATDHTKVGVIARTRGDLDLTTARLRAGDPSEIGPVIAFVASRRNSYMTGANINVDGGSDFC